MEVIDKLCFGGSAGSEVIKNSPLSAAKGKH